MRNAVYTFKKISSCTKNNFTGGFLNAYYVKGVPSANESLKLLLQILNLQSYTLSELQENSCKLYSAEIQINTLLT